MKFFTLLAVLALRKLPGQKLTQPLDALFAKWQNWLAAKLKTNLGSTQVVLASLLPILASLVLVLWLLEGKWWFLPTLAVHLLVIFYALGRRCDLVWLTKYLAARKNEDLEAANHYAENILTSKLVGLDPKEVHAKVLARLIVVAFDRLFLVTFWYLVFGPLGALLARLVEELVNNANQKQLENYDSLPDCCSPQLIYLQKTLRWPAARLMGLTLGLTGRPLLGLLQFSKDLLRFNLPTEEFLNRQLVTGFGVLTKNQDCTAASFYQRPEAATLAADEELEKLSERIWRSLGVWIGLAAVAVILGSL